MLRFVTGRELARYPRLCASMFSDRARQFRDRLGWQVHVDDNGWEQDQYDPLNPLYVIWEEPDGSHGGSMRFLPTTGRTMVAEHFSHLVLEPSEVFGPAIWECTRFCVSEQASTKVSAMLMLGGAEVGRAYGLAKAVGVFDARMVRIYRLLGWTPDIVAREGMGQDAIGLGLWVFAEPTRRMLAERAGISAELSTHWFAQSRGPGAIAA
jgi:acyl homoserine lactone synthase